MRIFTILLLGLLLITCQPKEATPAVEETPVSGVQANSPTAPADEPELIVQPKKAIAPIENAPAIDDAALAAWERTKRSRMNAVQNGMKITTGGAIYDVDSTKFTLQNFRGKYIALSFWEVSCDPCFNHAPDFSGVVKRMESDKLTFINVSIDKDFSFWSNYVQNGNYFGNNYWIGPDENHPLFPLLYQTLEIGEEQSIIYGVPRYILIGPDMKIIENNMPLPTNKRYEQILANL